MKAMKNITFCAIIFSALIGARAEFCMAHDHANHHIALGDLYTRVHSLGLEQDGTLNDPTLLADITTFTRAPAQSFLGGIVQYAGFRKTSHAKLCGALVYFNNRFAFAFHADGTPNGTHTDLHETIALVRATLLKIADLKKAYEAEHSLGSWFKKLTQEIVFKFSKK